ncbi:MAG: hypothetical protein MUC36_04725 [Planctomycetes bacterium]|jgi:hypothetical protein|nr:hypothetical protein [Planctomycetota bacterium]
MLAQRPQLIPPIPGPVRFLVFGVVIAILVYGMASIGAEPKPVASTENQPTEVAVPALDRNLLAQAKDDDREQRLQLEAEPLRHLLAKAIDVGPTVAAALGMPEQPLAVATVRNEKELWRGRWIWFEGVLEQLNGPREGNPVPGYSIYEATVRTAAGDAVLAAFSIPPERGLERGSWVRIEGYLLKLVDITYPTDLREAPMLVGRQIHRDYEDWPPVQTLDPAMMSKVDDSSYWPGDLMWHTLEEDQTEPLWHLAAFVRDTADRRTLADWRQIEILQAGLHDRLRDGEIPRGTPMRVFGTLIQRTTMAAPANPAGIKSWTVAMLQCREYGGTLVPVWVPKRVAELEPRASLEVRGFYYRWFAYETRNGERRRAPLFLAADLDVYDLEVNRTMEGIGLWLAGLACVLLLLAWWSQRRTARSEVQHRREMDERRRRRQAKAAAASGSPGQAQG